MNITYLTGDATCPSGKSLIINICNTVGKWENKFAIALSKKWPHPEHMYLNDSRRHLGFVQIVQVSEQIWVANIIAKNSTTSARSLSYDALAVGLFNVRTFLKSNKNISVHIPRIGGGGKVEIVDGIIAGELRNRNVFVYDL
jgi:hypothetical protein